MRLLKALLELTDPLLCLPLELRQCLRLELTRRRRLRLYRGAEPCTVLKALTLLGLEPLLQLILLHVVERAQLRT
jgi:hypothetical protein